MTTTKRKPPRVETCRLNHGWPGNAATVYGHPGSVRVCIRIHGTDTWVYSPGWEAKP
jgi:hypothetical protein